MRIMIAAESTAPVITTSMSPEMLEAFTKAFTQVKTDVVGMVTTALPIALGIMGLFLAIRLGIGFFKSVAN